MPVLLVKQRISVSEPPFHKVDFDVLVLASEVRTSEKVKLSRIGSRLPAFQLAIYEVRTLPLTPHWVAQKSEFVV